MTVEVWLDGEKQKEVQITAEDLFTFDNKFVLGRRRRSRPASTRSRCARRGRGRSTSTPT